MFDFICWGHLALNRARSPQDSLLADRLYLQNDTIHYGPMHQPRRLAGLLQKHRRIISPIEGRFRKMDDESMA